MPRTGSVKVKGDTNVKQHPTPRSALWGLRGEKGKGWPLVKPGDASLGSYIVLRSFLPRLLSFSTQMTLSVKWTRWHLSSMWTLPMPYADLGRGKCMLSNYISKGAHTELVS